jgi:hypothetical protein
MLHSRSELLNYVANQPEVICGIAPGYTGVDLSSLSAKPNTLIFGDEHGVLMFNYLGDGIYEGHYLFTDTLARRDAMKLARRAIKELFTTHCASAINGVTPRANLGARAFNRALGLVPVGEATDTAGRSCIKYRLERASWHHSLDRRLV